MNKQFDEYLAGQGIVHYYESDWYRDRLEFFSAGAKAERRKGSSNRSPRDRKPERVERRIKERANDDNG